MADEIISSNIEDLIQDEMARADSGTLPSLPSRQNETPAERRERLIKERDELRQEEELEELEKEIRILRWRKEKRDNEEPDTQDSGSTATPTEDTRTSAAKRRRDTESEGRPTSPRKAHSRSDIRVVKPDTYNGKSLHALREYVRRCETAFRLRPESYPDDARRVLYASQFLTGESAEAWLRLESENGEDNTTWEQYTTFLRDLQQDPITRATSMARRYNDAAQRPGQTVVQFANYMDQLEAELPSYTDAQRMQHLYAKLLPDIRTVLNNYQELPKTRTDLIKLATQLEANLPARTRLAQATREATNDTKDKNKTKPRGTDGGGKEATTNNSRASSSSRPNSRPRPRLSPEERERRAKENLCFICESPEHKAAICPERDSTSTPKTTTTHDKSKNWKSQ
jgi:hypothetical protein